MFYLKNNIWQSDILSAANVRHGFSTRLGGVSTVPHLASMNVGFLRGDEDKNVEENIRILCDETGCPHSVVCAPQIHSVRIKTVTQANIGEGTVRDTDACDGFFCDTPGITLLVRVADCAPILMCGTKENGSAAVAAVHAGWRGAAAGIAAKAVYMMKEAGVQNIKAAIGACIHQCCYEVGHDMRDAVKSLCGENTADKYIAYREGRLFADIAGINAEMLRCAGADDIDICPECTACMPSRYHSHRATGGVRGTMGAVIAITQPQMG